jgi:glycosyltransferase involved in cell wall biosynthesis
MKILFIVPGSGDSFYCGNCFRDNLQANALRNAGHDVVIMPLYLPFRYPSFKAGTPLFFPATTFYASQMFFKKGGIPRWLSRLLESKAMLRVASAFSGTTSAAGLEGITLSMIHGIDAVFAEQVNPMLDWIEHHEKPDIIHLSTTLLIGVAKAVKQRVDIPVVCSLQDEEIWIDSLRGDYRNEAWQGIISNIMYVDRFVTTSEFYKKAITARIPQITDVDVIYPGVDVSMYSSDRYPANPVIGFFYRMNRENGLDILAEAFVILKKRGTVKNLKLKVAGGYTSADRRFLKEVKKTLRPYMNDVEMSSVYSPEEHAGFYRQISVICVPVTFDEGVGLYLCEAFAAGRPAVEPATGSFPEIAGEAGVVYEEPPFPPRGGLRGAPLADALEKLLADKNLFGHCCEKALEMSRTRYNYKVMAEKLIMNYKKYISLQPF